MKKKAIRDKYFDYVTKKEKPPSSLRSFLKYAGLRKSQFLEKYDDLQEVESDIWRFALRDTLESLEKSVDFVRYSSKDQGLAFVYSWFECMDLNRDFFSNCKFMKMGPMASQKHLKRFKKRVDKFVKDMIKRGKSMSEFKDRGLPGDHMTKMFWSILCMNMSSWQKCKTKKCKSKQSKKKAEDWMDAMVEKSMVFFFDSLAPNLFDTFFDMLKHKRSK